MRLHRPIGGVVAALCLAAACSSESTRPSPDGESTNREALTGFTAPVPATFDGAGKVAVAWTGTPGELVFADALAVCSTLPTGEPRGAAVQDSKLRALREKMDATIGKYPALPTKTWMALRNDANHNAKPISNARMSAGLEGAYPKTYDVYKGSSLAASTASAKALQQFLDVAAVNLCIARGVSEQMRFGATLLTSSADQRYLLELVRERAQLAMLQLANLASALSHGGGAHDYETTDEVAYELFGKLDAPPPQDELDPAIKKNTFAEEMIPVWRSDLTEALSLHIAATEKLATLFARSAAARDPLSSSSPSDDGFTAGGWRSRILALLYGGDPLAADNPGIAPPEPAVGAPAAGVTPGPGWPDNWTLPRATPGLWTARAVRFYGFVHHHDVLSLALVPGKATFQSRADIDIAASALWLYREIEAAVRTAACGTRKPDHTCAILRGKDITEPLTLGGSLAAFEVAKRHGLTLDDAVALVTAIVDLLPSTTAITGYHLLGRTELVAASASSPAFLRIPSRTQIVPRSMLEAASAHARLGRHHLPMNVARGALGELVQGKSEALYDGARVTGAVAALATVREALAAARASTYKAAKDFAEGGADALIRAAIGDSQVTLRGVEGTSASGDAVVHAVGASPGTRRWRLTVRPSPEDAFWSSSRPSDYAIVAVDNPSAMTVLIDPSTTRAGFPSVAALVARSVSKAVVSRPSSANSLSAELVLPEGKQVTVFATRRTTDGIDARPLTGPITPWAARNADQTPVPLDGAYIALGGRLTAIATQAHTPATWDYAAPAFDGFGNPRGRVPARSLLWLGGGGDVLGNYLKHYMDAAKEAEATARTSIVGVLGRLESNTEGEVEVETARLRQVADTQIALKSFCGDDGAKAGTDASGNAAAEQACGVRFVSIHSLGSTSEELTTACGGPVPSTRWNPDWQTAVQCDASGTAEANMKCSLDALGAVLGFPVEVATQVACAQHLPTPALFGNVRGSLQMRLMAQFEALRAYRDTAREFESAGRVALTRAKAADQALAVAHAQVDLAQARADLAKSNGLRELADLSRAVAEAAKRTETAGNQLAELTGMDADDLVQAGMNMYKGGVTGLSGGAALGAAGGALATAALGAAAGSAVPGIGTAVGFVGGVIVGFLMSGPSEEEIAAAQAALEQAALAEKHAREREADYAKHLGLCQTNPGAASNPAWGDCPKGPALATALGIANQEKLIQELDAAMARTGAILAVQEGTKQLREKLTGLNLAASKLVAESAALRNDLLEVDLRLEQAKVMATLEAKRQNGRFAVSKAFHADAMWTANGLMETARYASSDARRAVEFVTATDLSKSTQLDGTTSLAAPAGWADQIYDYDASELRFVGATAGTSTAPSATKIQNYLGNLTAFNQGFLTWSGTQYTAMGVNSTLVDGPAATTTERIEYDDGTSEDRSMPTPKAYTWMVHCEQGAACVPPGSKDGGWCSAPVGSFANACRRPDGAAGPPLKPTAARVLFRLDAHGRHGATSPPSLAEGRRWNGRWARFAINLVGKQIQSCGAAPCPPGSGVVPYVLRHHGPFFVTDTNQQLRVVALNDHAISGDASDTDKVIETPLNNLDTPPLVSIRRPEFVGSPLEGLYELELFPRPGDDLGKIAKVQIVFEPTFFQPTNL